MLETIERMCPEADGDFEGIRDGARGLDASPPRLPAPALVDSAAVTATRSGYLQAIDIHPVVERATQDDVRIDVVRTPGEYVSEGTTLARVTPPERLSDELRRSVNRSVVLGSSPTPAQDLAYGPRQLSEIAIRALSPGVNDPGTAIMCLDRLTEGLALLVRRQMPPDEHADEQGCVRLTTRRASIERLFDVSLAQIRRYGAGDIEVLSRILRLLADVGEVARSPRHRDALRENARLVLDDGMRELETEVDRRRLKLELDVVLDALNGRPTYG
jgi:uncharacterized membrane protein